jgi:hypothetical protein
MTIQTEGLLMAIGAVVPRPLGKQAVLLHEKGAVIVHDTGSVMADPTLFGFGAFEFPVIGPGICETDDHKETSHRQHCNFKCFMVNHDLSSHVQ